MPIESYRNGGNDYNKNQRRGHQPRRTSKFPGLRGFVQLNSSNNEFPLDYELGQQVPYAKVGSILSINHPDEKEIDDRIVVIFRTNNESWSCYEFCRNTDRGECENQNFQAEHAQVVSETTAQANSAEGVPRVMLKIRDASDNTLEVDSGVWINCRQILDIKHTVTFADLDKNPHANTQSGAPGTSNQQPAGGTSTPPATAGSETRNMPHTPAATTLPHRPPIDRTAGSSSRPPPAPAPAPTTPVGRPRRGSGKPKPKSKPKLSLLDKGALKFTQYTQT